jgi:hypothetical protein
MASPHTAGVAAIMLSEKPYTPAALEAEIKLRAVLSKIKNVPSGFPTPNALLQVKSTTSQIDCTGKHGPYYCDPSNPFKFALCNWGSAVYFDVPPGTKCFQQTETAIIFVFA